MTALVKGSRAPLSAWLLVVMTMSSVYRGRAYTPCSSIPGFESATPLIPTSVSELETALTEIAGAAAAIRIITLQGGTIDWFASPGPKQYTFPANVKLCIQGVDSSAPNTPPLQSVTMKNYQLTGKGVLALSNIRIDSNLFGTNQRSLNCEGPTDALATLVTYGLIINNPQFIAIRLNRCFATLNGITRILADDTTSVGNQRNTVIALQTSAGSLTVNGPFTVRGITSQNGVMFGQSVNTPVTFNGPVFLETNTLDNPAISNGAIIKLSTYGGTMTFNNAVTMAANTGGLTDYASCLACYNNPDGKVIFNGPFTAQNNRFGEAGVMFVRQGCTVTFNNADGTGFARFLNNEGLVAGALISEFEPGAVSPGKFIFNTPVFFTGNTATGTTPVASTILAKAGTVAFHNTAVYDPSITTPLPNVVLLNTGTVTCGPPYAMGAVSFSLDPNKPDDCVNNIPLQIFNVNQSLTELIVDTNTTLSGLITSTNTSINERLTNINNALTNTNSSLSGLITSTNTSINERLTNINSTLSEQIKGVQDTLTATNQQCTPVSVFHKYYGCNGKDDDCDGTVDSCGEDKYAPDLRPCDNKDLHPTKWFSDLPAAKDFLCKAADPTDDCTPTTELQVDAALMEDACASSRFTVTATDKCSNSRTINATIPYDAKAPIISIGMQKALFKVNNVKKEDVGLAINASDNCDSKLAATLTVWSDEGYSPLYEKDWTESFAEALPLRDASGRLTGWRLYLQPSAFRICREPRLCSPTTTSASWGRTYTVQVCVKDEAGLQTCAVERVQVKLGRTSRRALGVKEPGVFSRTSMATRGLHPSHADNGQLFKLLEATGVLGSA